MIPAPPIPTPRSNLVPHRAASVGSSDIVIGSRQDLLDRPAIQSVPPASSLVAGSPIEVPQTAPISAPLPTSVTCTIKPRPPIADFHYQPSAPPVRATPLYLCCPYYSIECLPNEYCKCPSQGFGGYSKPIKFCPPCSNSITSHSTYSHCSE